MFFPCDWVSISWPDSRAYQVEPVLWLNLICARIGGQAQPEILVKKKEFGANPYDSG